METFTELKELTKNPHYPVQRKIILQDLCDDMLDLPTIDLIRGFNKLPYCFTLQSCYGHFSYKGYNDSHNLKPLGVKKNSQKISYRIAYIAFCIENSRLGRKLFAALNEITAIDPQNVQFCCAEWFWKKQVNSYALQVEPDRFKHKDRAILDFNEASHIENIRDGLFMQLYGLIEKG